MSDQGGDGAEHSHAWIAWVWAGGLFLVFWGLAMARVHTLMGSYDLGYFDQAAWLITHGHTPFVTVRGLHLLGDHGSFAFYPFALVGRGTTGLLALQAGALALGAVPLWHIARRLNRLPIGPCVALLGAYSLYPALSNVDLFDFHPECLVVPALLAAAYFGLRRGPRTALPYAACLIAVFATREDVAVPVLFLGLVLVLDGARRLGAATMAAAAVWLAVDLAVVLPHYAGGDYVQGNRFGQYGATLSQAAWHMATHPLTVAGDFATKPNLYVVVGLLAPVLFLPLLAPKYLLPAAPLQLAYLLTNVAASHTITAQYTVSTTPFVFVATAFALGRLHRSNRLPAHRLMVAAAAVGFVVFATASPRHSPWRWLHRDRTDQARLAAARLVPKGASTSASIRMWPLLADRKALYNFPNPMEGYLAQSPDPVPLPKRVAQLQWIVLDTADAEQWTPPLAQARDRLIGPGNPLGFHVVFDRAGIVVYRRGP